MATIEKAKVLVVGAGGIGCELLKNLVLSGFRDIHVIDLDTIDFSNLNRQFLFRKEHVGKSKAVVAKESVEKFCPEANIKSYHDTIIKQEYNRDFFTQFNIVLNALDNRAARNHVNRLCLAANIPLVESGTQGYLGQVTPILKGKSECYECRPKGAQKTYANCTIRNTPSEPIHCIVWAKHLFNQLFGLLEADEEVSPDSTDPELGGKVTADQLATNDTGGNVVRISTRQWAKECGYNCEKIFNKLFHDDIVYLRNMEDLWKKRRAPEPLKWPQEEEEAITNGGRDQRVWSLVECARVFKESVSSLKDKLQVLAEGDYLTWDKDDQDSLDFVTACSNIRSEAFGIACKSQFEVKSMAGNIIPAIATTNAVISGLLVLQAIKILKGESSKCNNLYLGRMPHPVNHRVVNVLPLDPPNPKCYACSEKSEVFVHINTITTVMRNFRDRVLKDYLNMSAPDVVLDGRIVISSEDGETDDVEDKTMAELGMTHCARLQCDDFLQNFELVVNVVHTTKAFEDGKEFEVLGELPKAKADIDMKDKVENGKESDDGDHNDDDDDECIIQDDDDDLVVVCEDENDNQETEQEPGPPSKKKRVE